MDGGAAVDALLSLLEELLAERFGMQYHPSWVLELDSSSATKFSRHLVLRLSGAALASNAHAGALVRELCRRAAAARATDPRAAALFVRDKDGGETMFIDTAVYTRNRAFRLFLSSKAGKNEVLQCTGRFWGAAAATQRDTFFASLILDVPSGSRLLHCFEPDEEERSAAGATAGLARRHRAAQVCHGPSPYPGIEAFITSVCTQGGVQGRVRSWTLLDGCGGGVVLFNIAGNRYCGNVGRQHCSNGTFYLVDLQHGWWCQRCYDPDCRDYRSPLTALPLSLCQEQQQREAAAQGPAACRAADPKLEGEAAPGTGQGSSGHGQEAGDNDISDEVTLAASRQHDDISDEVMLAALDEHERQLVAAAAAGCSWTANPQAGPRRQRPPTAHPCLQ